MDPLSNNVPSIEAFLPLYRMTTAASEASIAYVSAKPYPHVVLDNFFEPKILDQILCEFPKPGQINWQRFDNPQEKKLASNSEMDFGPMTRLFLYHLNSVTFLNFLSEVTGINNLLPDPSFEGGGLHQIERGGKLGIHADFNKHSRYSLDRRLNLIIYLNKNWLEEYGGHFELWDKNMNRCEKKILPVFNRLVIFGTTSETFHGHPDPLACPENMSRKSLALYYFSNGRPAEETSDVHSTLFKARNEIDFRPTFSQQIRATARDFLPPVLVRQFTRGQ